MADPFETELSALFDEAPAYADTAAFTARFERRRAREFGWRRLWLGGAGVIGAGIAITQGFGSGLGERMAAAVSATDTMVGQLVATGGAGGAVSADTVTMILVVAGLGVLLLALRAAQEI